MRVLRATVKRGPRIKLTGSRVIVRVRLRVSPKIIFHAWMADYMFILQIMEEMEERRRHI